MARPVIQSGLESRLLVILILTLYSVPVMGSVLERPAERPGEGVEKLDPYLDRVLNGEVDEGQDDIISVVVQFYPSPMDGHLEQASSLGFSLVHRFSSIRAATLKGPRDAVAELADYSGCRWIEYDGEMHLMMEESTGTINATVAWDTWIEGARQRYPQATGEGVTVAVVDTGIDAGHPDLDYGEKTIFNLKSDIPGAPFYELENSDTSYGHGTHCAGTIAGNGDASAGARRGVAPESKLIGLSIGDVGITLTNTLQGLEWVYENSRPPNPHNIRVVSNSWGGGAAEYDPEDATSKICQKLTYDNNVLVVFAMGNSGSDQHEGEELTASPTGLIPSNIGVAASERDGSGVAYFSSRGEKGKNQTYPDVAAPGVRIWSAHARVTQISAMNKVLSRNPNPYYLAISGTSMATPHVSGLAALMFQVAPSLKISDVYEDYSGDDNESWYGNEFNRIHEIEWIMEQSASYIPPDGTPLSDSDGDNGVPEPGDLETTEVGKNGRTMDWAQGYGLVDAEKCIGIAATLEQLRRNYDFGTTVQEAYDVYMKGGVFHEHVKVMETDTLMTSWSGEFARYAQDQDIPMLVQNQSRVIWVPENGSSMDITLQYGALSLEEGTIGDLTFVVDYENDGSWDYQEPFGGSWTSGIKEHTFDVGDNGGSEWAIGIYGRGLKRFKPFRSGEYFELRIEYSIGVEMLMDTGDGNNIDVVPPHPNSMLSQWWAGDPSSSYQGGEIRLKGTIYDVDRMVPLPDEEGGGGEGGGFPLWIIFALLIMAAASIGYLVYRGTSKK